MNKISLDDRMKQYENCFKYCLPRNSYVVLRLDMRNGRGYCKELEKPFDDGFIEDMQSSMSGLCKEIENCVLAYHQSDEISLLLYDGFKPETQPWFDNKINKLNSLSASELSNIFNKKRLFRYMRERHEDNGRVMIAQDVPDFDFAQFDCRSFVLPNITEVVNYFVWRQQDCIKNSLQMLARSMYPHNVLQNKNCLELRGLCVKGGMDWNNLDNCKKMGSMAYQIPVNCLSDEGDIFVRNRWFLNRDIPYLIDDFDFTKDKIGRFEKQNENK